MRDGGTRVSLSLSQPEVSFNSTSMEKAQVHLRSPPSSYYFSSVKGLGADYYKKKREKAWGDLPVTAM